MCPMGIAVANDTFGFDHNNDNDNDNENNFIVMKLHFHSLYKSDIIPNEDCFSLAKKTCIMYNAQEKWL